MKQLSFSDLEWSLNRSKKTRGERQLDKERVEYQRYLKELRDIAS